MRDHQIFSVTWSKAGEHDVGFEGGPRVTRARFGSVLVQGTDWVTGPLVLGGVGLRSAGGRGELGLTLTASWLPAGAPVVGYRGNLGGLSGGLGYRWGF